MQVKRLVVGQLETNCYLVYDEKSRDCLIIDPGDEADFIKNKIRDLSLKPLAVLATHAHFDHVLAVLDIKLSYKIPFYLNKKDLKILKRAQKTAKYFLGGHPDPVALADKYFEAGQILKIKNYELKILATPGHTPGSLSYLIGDGLTDKKTGRVLGVFVGDLIFKDGGYGRTDLEGGNKNDLLNSIKKILKLKPETIIYPGHGEITSVGKERKFWKELLK